MDFEVRYCGFGIKLVQYAYSWQQKGPTNRVKLKDAEYTAFEREARHVPVSTY